MELKEFKEKLYQKLVLAGDVEDEEEAHEAFLTESIEFDRPMLIFLEIVNEAVQEVLDQIPKNSCVNG